MKTSETTLSLEGPSSKLIFDQFSRYLPTAKVIQLCTDNSLTSVLDVGSGDECILGQLLAEHQFTFIDPLLAGKNPDNPNHRLLADDFFTADFEKKEFGVVTNVDVLEHVPPEVRPQFLARIEELADDLVIMSFPCTELESAALDNHMNEVYSAVFGKNYPWLDEHFRYGLPSSRDVETFFEERGWHTYCFGHGYLPWLEEFLSFSLSALDIPILRQIVFKFSRKFNEIAIDADICPPCYRRVFIASKREIGTDLNMLFPSDIQQQYLPEITKELKACFYTELLKVCRVKSDDFELLSRELDFRRSRDQHIPDDLLDRINALVQEHAFEQSRFFNEESTDETTSAAETASEQLSVTDINEWQTEKTALKTRLENVEEKLERYSNKIEELLHSQTSLKIQLEEEKVSILKPLLRRMYTLAKSVFLHLPGPVQAVIRKVKNKSTSILKSLLKQSQTPPTVDLILQKEYLDQIKNCEYTGDDIFIFPVIDWHFRIQRPQHLARQLAEKGHRVFYFSTTFQRKDAGITVLEQLDERIFLCQLHLPDPHPTIYEQAPTQSQVDFMTQSLDQLSRAAGIKTTTAMVDHPFWTSVALNLPSTMVVYDCMDDHGSFHNTAQQILDEETRLLEKADLVITTSATLSDKIARQRENTLVRNAADSEWFATPPEHLRYQSEKPVVGYFGAISEWFDIDLIIKAADACPEYDFVLIGSTYLCDIKRAQEVDNIHFIGEVPYEDLKGYLYAFDVCLIPFQICELIHHTNPVKLYEYLAAGKPVVATAMPELKLVDEHVYVSDDAESFISNIHQALAEKDDVAGIEKRRSFALQNQWSNRVESLETAITKTYPSVSVVVLTYNNLHLTRECLESLMEFTEYPNWELILVDNASTDGTPDYLTQFAEQHENVKVFLNQDNLGFAAGNNVGIRNSTSDYVVLLNNDTYVTRGWLWGLVRYFQQDPHLGLLGPVTNNIGNEAKIAIEYSDFESMATESRKYTSQHARELFYINTVAFFCAVIRREVLDEVGLLDEAFKCGFFEDDDFCVRARNAGFKVGVAEDVFIHHHLSASFNQMKQDARKELFETNKAIYEEKWGPWTPHTYRS